MATNCTKLTSTPRSVATDEKRAFVETPCAFKLVVSQRQVRLEAAAREIGDRHDALATRLATINTQQSLLAIPAVEVRSLELAAAQPGAINKSEHGEPEVLAVRTARVGGCTPQRFHVRTVQARGSRE